MEKLMIKELYHDLNKTLAKELLEEKTYPWEVLPCIGDYILKLGETLDEAEYEKKGDNVWIAKTAKVAPTPISMVLRLLERMQRFVIVLLSEGMLW